MILPDLNLLIHAYNAGSPFHGQAKAWWESRMNNSRPVGLCWAVLLGFIRITTHRKILDHPLPVEVACGHVRSWLTQPQVIMLDPGSRHAEIVFGLLEELGTAGNLTTDAHLAVLAIEHNAELYSNDADFSRFPGLKWIDPLKPRSSSKPE